MYYLIQYLSMIQSNWNLPNFQDMEHMDPEFWDLPDLVNDDLYIPPIRVERYIALFEPDVNDNQLNVGQIKLLTSANEL